MAPSTTTSDPLAKAVREFNRWRFYDCHETLENVWREAGGKSAVAATGAGFYHGLIKLAAGFHHLLRANHHGAVTLLADGLRLLSPYAPTRHGIDVAGLLEETRACLDRLQDLGPGRLDAFDRGLIPRLRWVENGEAVDNGSWTGDSGQ